MTNDFPDGLLICLDAERHEEHGPWTPMLSEQDRQDDLNALARDRVIEAIEAGFYSIRGLRKLSGYRVDRNTIRALLSRLAPEYLEECQQERDRVWREVIQPNLAKYNARWAKQARRDRAKELINGHLREAERNMRLWP